MSLNIDQSLRKYPLYIKIKSNENVEILLIRDICNSSSQVRLSCLPMFPFLKNVKV